MLVCSVDNFWIVRINKSANLRVVVTGVEIIEPGFGWILLCTRMGCPHPGHFFGRLFAEKENVTAMYRQTSPFGDKRQVVEENPSSLKVSGIFLTSLRLGDQTRCLPVR